MAALGCGGGLLVGCGGGAFLLKEFTKRQAVKDTRKSDFTKGRKLSSAPAELEKARLEASDKGSTEAEWLNDIMLKLWPRIDTFVQKKIKESVEPSIQAKLPGMISFSFTKVTLGKAAPRFGPIHTTPVGHPDNDKDDIRIRLGLDLSTELEVDISCAGVPIGVKKLLFRGVLTIVMRPPQDKPPFFGGLELYFANPPQVDLDFSGVASIAEAPGIRGIIRSTISNAINGKLVLPSRIAVDMNEDDSVSKGALATPDPEGVIRLTLLSGKKLSAMDTGMLGGQSSDPYVIIEAGQSPWTSPVVKGTVDPQWTENNVKDIMVYDRRQEVSFQIFDQDFMNTDDAMGVIKGVELAQFMKPSSKPLAKTLKIEEAEGTLNIQTEYLTLTDKGPSTKIMGDKVYVAVLIKDATGLPDGAVPPYVITATIGAKTAVTNGSAAQGYKGGAIPAEQKEIALRLQQSKKGKFEAKDIAEVIGLTEDQVNRLLLSADGAAEAATHRAAQKPSWDQVLPMMMPWDDKSSALEVVLELKDSKKKVLGTVKPCAMKDIINGKEVDGTFTFGGIKLRASCHAKWLENSQL